MTTDRLKRGDYVRVRLAGSSDDWAEGLVILASEANPSSVCLMVSGIVRSGEGAWIGGGLPLTVDYEAQRVTSLLDDEYEIEVADCR